MAFSQDLSDDIRRLLDEKGVTLLAHYYQSIDVQRLAHFIGDSLELAKTAKEAIATPYILFAGVRFMAETAAILNPAKTVLLPDPTAGCPMADFLTGEDVKAFRARSPGSPVVLYVNTTAEAKAQADICCTSSNAVAISRKIADEFDTDTILFGPDKNLAAYVQSQTGLHVIPIPPKGNCPIHNQFTLGHVKEARAAHPGASLLVHPESPVDVQAEAEFIGSTTGMLRYTQSHVNPEGFILGTEVGLAAHLRWKHPKGRYFSLSETSACKNMKKITLGNILSVLHSISTPALRPYEVRVEPQTADQAARAIDRMIALS